MTPERWQKVKEIFQAALERRPEDRARFIATECGDEGLRLEVESLIAAYEKDGSFIDSPAYQEGAELLIHEPAELKSGHTIDAYEIVSFIGRGGMGEVYLAQDKRLGRRVALKLLPVSFAKDAERLRRFQQEARAASALNHPNIITIHEIREANSTLMITTEFVEGETLRQSLAQGRLELPKALNIAIQIADALAAAHQAGIVHRDIKPENVMLRPDGYVKVLDFGLAKLTEHVTPSSDAETPTKRVKTGSGVIIGTVGYMSPEQARGKGVDARSDIFSLGAVIYEMVGGEKPFEGETPSDVLAAILKSEPPPLSELAPAVPPELVRIVSKSLCKDREQRYQVVRDLLIDLRSLKEELDFQARLNHSDQADAVHAPMARPLKDSPADSSELKTAVSTFTHSLSAEIKRHKTGTAVVASLLLVAIGAGIYGIWRLLNRGRAESGEAPQVLRTTQIPMATGLEIPALSPDGNSIAYSSQMAGAAEIFVKPLTPGAREIQLTSDRQGNIEPAWSPDGKLIAFHSVHGGIWIIPASGGIVRKLTDFGAWPAWSADGSSIAFQSESSIMPPSTIWTVSSQGGTPIQITQMGQPAGGHSLPAWSPSGDYLVFVAYTGARQGELWKVPAKGGEPKPVIKSRIWFLSPVYSPKGDFLYAGAFAENGNFIYRLRVSPNGEALDNPVIVADLGLARITGRLTISADGKKFVCGTGISAGNLVSLPISPITHEPSGEPQPLTQNTSYRKTMPRFSPDGKKIAFLQFWAGENQKIWIMDADGANPTQLTTGPTVDWSPSWFPDNDTIAFLSNEEEQTYQRMWSVSVSTRQRKLLFDPGQEIGWPRLSPDGKQFAFNSTKGGTINVWSVPVEGGTPRQLTFDSEQTGWPCWSPDGTLLAFSRRQESSYGIVTMPGSGGEITSLTKDGGRLNDWSPDGDKVVFSALRGGVWNIFWVSRSTNQVKQLTHYTNQSTFVAYPDWSPQDDQIVYEYAETSGNIWLMELK
jgi:Tol biopolymer transport system component